MDFTRQRRKNEENGDYFFLEYANAYYLLKCHVTYLLIDKVGQFHSCYKEKSESLQTEGRHFRSTICKINDV